MNDYISFFSSVLNQSVKANKIVAFVPNNKINFILSSVFYKENFIYSYNINYYSNKIKIYFNKLDNKFIFSKIVRISKPSKRVYWRISELKRKSLKEGRFFIISTSFGIMSSNEAIKKNISGEILMEIVF